MTEQVLRVPQYLLLQLRVLIRTRAQALIPAQVQARVLLQVQVLLRVRAEALNELAILRDRFGGQMAKAAIVTAERGSTVMRNRAGELNIRVIDLSDLQAGRAKERIRALMRAER